MHKAKRKYSTMLMFRFDDFYQIIFVIAIHDSISLIFHLELEGLWYALCYNKICKLNTLLNSFTKYMAWCKSSKFHISIFEDFQNLCLIFGTKISKKL